MIKMISPNGKICDIPENKVERNLNRGFSLADTPKTTEPVEVQETEEVQDSHEEIDQNEEQIDGE